MTKSAAILSWALGFTPAILGAAPYQVTEFGPNVTPTALNDLGDVAGMRRPDGNPPSNPFLWRPTEQNGTTGAFLDLPRAPTDVGSSFVAGLNNARQLVGASGSDVGHRPILWSPSPADPAAYSVHDLGNPPEAHSAHSARNINDAGQIIGHQTHRIALGGALAPDRSFLWTPSTPGGTTGTRRNIPGSPSYSANVAHDINEVGQVTGRMFRFGTHPETINRGYIWSTTAPAGTPPVDIGLPPTGEWQDVFPLSINNRGQVVGYASDNSGRYHAFLWNPHQPNGTTGAMQLLDPLEYAVAVNDSGLVLGYGGLPQRAYLWTDAGGAVPLDSLIDPALNIRFHSATAINNKGQILAWETTHRTRIFLLTPNLAADFNGDNQINADDLSAWSANFGMTEGATKTHGDADADLDADGADFLAWQRDAGLSLGQAAATAVPEPATAALVLAALPLRVRRSRRTYVGRGYGAFPAELAHS
jgi:probable HAF family extracellular repeat protein